MTLELAFNILLAIASGALGLLIKRLYSVIDAQSDKIERILVHYQPRSDAHNNQNQILGAIKEVKSMVDKLNDKLDRKADK
ncbi:hypothetical protein [Neisseria sp. Ec49-e6-T10]|uniref:hypothetical protein n=1 Tax=Neisseria sp. Ec49-e6-T10 TaxID=3140744 RepID=UPI003EBB2D9F